MAVTEETAEESVTRDKRVNEETGEIWGEITEAGLVRLRERIDVPRRDGSSMFPAKRIPVGIELAHRMANGIADRNPLYVDEEYAKASPWGRLQCPPAILAWTEKVNGATDGFPGCHTIWREGELEWNRPIFVGDVLNSTTYLRDARITESRFSKVAAVQDYETVVINGDDENDVIGFYRSSWHRFSRKAAKDAAKGMGSAMAEIERPHWSDVDLEKVWDEYRKQNFNRRGSEPLYFEDVSEGDEVPYLVKGPTTLASKIAFESIGGPGGWFVGHELALDLFERHPGLAIRNEENVPEPPVAIHWTNERCQKYLGMPAGYEAGYERINWLTQMLMTWMGDHGLIRKLSFRFKGFHWQGDVVRLYATVVSKEVVDGRNEVTLEIETKSHRGETTTKGKATVALPSKTQAK